MIKSTYCSFKGLTLSASQPPFTLLTENPMFSSEVCRHCHIAYKYTQTNLYKTLPEVVRVNNALSMCYILS